MFKQLINQKIDRYQVVSLLGEGGMGAVYKARDLTLQRDVAIKMMHPQYARNPSFQQRFLQEARTAARLDHPGIVQVFDFKQLDDMLYIVMELIPGRNLSQILQDLRAKKEWIQLHEATFIVHEVALALDYAHLHGVLHRDIKASNIMLEPDPSGKQPFRPVITDLGLAKLAEGGMMTQEGTSMGTPAYMSPEQALGKATDARSDVYSLGVLLFELAAGQLPFPAKTLTEAIRFHTQEPPPRPRAIRPDLPPLLEAIILQALEKDPAKRFQSGAALATALEAVHSAPTAIGEHTVLTEEISRLTEVDPHQERGRGPSVLDEFGSPPSQAGDQIQILSADQTTRTVTIQSTAIVAGREPGPGLRIDDQKASRQHARIEYDGRQYLVTDLNSTNGTYLRNDRLLPGVPEPWTQDKVLRIGDTYLRLVLAPKSPPAPLAQPPAAAGDITGSYPARPGALLVDLTVREPSLTVEPGSVATLTLVVRNLDSLVHHLGVAVEGLPNAWLPPTLPTVQLMPGDQQAIELPVHVPRSSQSRAGRYAFIVRANIKDEPAQVYEARCSLTVAAFTQFKTELHPQKIKAGETSQLTIHNQGNSPETFRCMCKDRGDEYIFHLKQNQVQVAEGHSAVIELRAAPRRKQWFGGERLSAFAVQVVPPRGDPQVFNGEVISKGILPPWLMAVIPVLCLFLIGGGLFGYSAYTNGQKTQAALLTQTWAAGETQIAMITAMQDSDGDGLTDVEEIRLQTDPLKADSDGDGLSDREEAGGVTSPTNADNDGDGLNDGQEKRYGSDPLVVDSDGDNLPDGTEVAQGTSPINPDSDGDGLNDRVDPDPGQLPTLTPIPPTATDTPVPPTHTPTPTLTPSPTQGGVWSGTWETTCDLLECGQLSLNYSGSTVQGTYANGNGSLEGTINGNRLTGAWTAGGTSGTFDFWMDSEGKSWQGNWDRTFFWCGARAGEAKPEPCGLASWYGEWETICGPNDCLKLNVIQTGKTIAGTYAGGAGRITGEVYGTTIKGSWQRNGSGNFSFYMLPDGKLFNGNWDSDNEWCGARSGLSVPNPCLNTGVTQMIFPTPFFVPGSVFKKLYIAPTPTPAFFRLILLPTATPTP